MNRTALDELIQWIDYDTKPIDCLIKAKQLLEKERQQIITAVMFNRDQNFNPQDAEDYFRKEYTFQGQYENSNARIDR